MIARSRASVVARRIAETSASLYGAWPRADAWGIARSRRTESRRVSSPRYQSFFWARYDANERSVIARLRRVFAFAAVRMYRSAWSTVRSARVARGWRARKA